MDWHTERKAGTRAEVRSRHDDNRAAWNEAAQTYTSENEERVRNLRSGKSNLHAIERATLARYGPLDTWCHRAIHLQCASGNDTLSLVLEGVHEVVGVDISDVHIENARWTSEQLGMSAKWYCCDVLDTPSELDGSADLVYTGRGAICWIHDIEAWAAVVARLLRKDGVMSLFDDHPASWLFSQETQELAASGVDYFEHAEANRGWTPEYIGDLGKSSEEHAVKHERLWTIADIFQALIEAGLVVEHLGEHPDEYWSAFPKLSGEDRRRLPMTFSLIARKP